VPDLYCECCIMLITNPIDLARFHGFRYAAARLLQMKASPKFASGRQLRHLRERAGQLFGLHLRKFQRREARRIRDETAFADPEQLYMASRMLSASELLADFV